MIVDLGTGDGRAVLARASAEPGNLVIGIDANAAAMAESSRRAARGHGPSGRNVMFLAHAVEAPSDPLAGVADLVTVTMPWGSLLRGVLGLDAAALGGLASLVAPSGTVEILTSVTPADGVPGLATLDEGVGARIASAWSAIGFELESMRPATAADLRHARSSWARRLAERRVWRIALVRRSPSGGAESDR